ncbi:type 1 phosphatase regulator ypi1 [Lasallia pustulata]|uniref:Type 1 phosphatases regulator n=1 Tax=Lasallia pustulata TaxID=136370 RepID=A0A1W5CTB2_9LECA|nr:type 1 phosphatase regulator ypi1 [Lasallia pustulata]
MSAPHFQRRAGPSTTAQPSHTTTTTRVEVAGTLRLRGVPAEDRRIRWAEDVVDNEGLGRKSSKVCCIYHAPRAVGESSSESSSDSSSSESKGDSEPDNSSARMGGKLQKGSSPSAAQP